MIFDPWPRAGRFPIVSAALLFSLLITGCGIDHRVQPDVAAQTLRKTMENWKEGKSPASLQSAEPAIVVQDMDWTGGAKLIDFQILDGAKPVDANLYAQVKLKLKDAAGAETEKTVTYVVGTSPALTVFRDMTR